MHAFTHLWVCQIQLIWNRDIPFTPLCYISVEYLTSCLPLYHTCQMSAFSLCTRIFCIIFCGKWICKISTILVLWLIICQPDKSGWQCLFSNCSQHDKQDRTSRTGQDQQDTSLWWLWVNQGDLTICFGIYDMWPKLLLSTDRGNK